VRVLADDTQFLNKEIVMSPLLKEALRRERGFKSIKRKNDFTNDELGVNWLDGLGVVFVLVLLFLMLNFI
jgi:hypothetical protein